MLEEQLHHFLARHLDPSRPVLLGLSGGPDSLALLYLLLDYGQQHPLDLHLAHVDHGWRAESPKETAILQRLAEELTLPFHATKLQDEDRRGNLEAAGRLARHRFFLQVSKEFDCQAVLLGHQADDVAETTLKRLVEGVSLPYLNGLQSVVPLDGLILWRPLLAVTKQQILNWLTLRGATTPSLSPLVPFVDSTNCDPKFLRGRIRQQAFPCLTRCFGKDARSGLHQIAQEADELHRYLNDRLTPFMAQLFSGPFGQLLDLSDRRPDTLYEVRYLVHQVIEKNGFYVSREILDVVTAQLIRGDADKRAQMKGYTLVVDRHRLFVLNGKGGFPPQGVSAKTLEEKDFGFQENQAQREWLVTRMPGETLAKPGWRHVWQGEATLSLPEGSYRLGPPHPGARLQLPGRETSLWRWWSNHKVPAFLRLQAPVIWSGGRVYAEFLSGRNPNLVQPAVWVVRLMCSVPESSKGLNTYVEGE